LVMLKMNAKPKNRIFFMGNYFLLKVK